MIDMDDTTDPVKCSKCANAPAGPGGILCGECLAKIRAGIIF